MKKLVMIFSFVFAFGFSTLPGLALAGNFQVPNYAQGQDVKQQVQSKGKDWTDLIAMVAAILDIMGIIYSSILMGTGKAQEGKEYLKWSIIGLMVIGMAYGIAIYAMK